MKSLTIVHISTALLAITGGILAYSDKLNEISAISPELAKYWPLIITIATAIDRLAKVFLPTEPPKS